MVFWDAVINFIVAIGREPSSSCDELKLDTDIVLPLCPTSCSLPLVCVLSYS